MSPEAQAIALRNAFPNYHVTLTEWPSITTWPEARPRFELVTVDDSNPWCLISSDAREIWNELKGAGKCLTCQTLAPMN